MILLLSLSRWLTTGNRFSRVWVGHHGFVGENHRILRLIIIHLAFHYFPGWFRIKCKPTLIDGPRHVFEEMKVVRDVLPEEIQDVVKRKVEDGAWMAHSEIVLLSLLASDEEEERRFAVKKLIAIRGESEYGDTSNRPFTVPKLNWSAKKLEEIIDWSSATESILTAKLSKDEIRGFLDHPFTMKAYPCHTQSVERLVKEVSVASAQVFGAERRDGYVLARCNARKLVPKVDRKADFDALL